MDYAFAYIVSNGGIHKEADYPYLMKDGTCEMKKVRTKLIILGRPVRVFTEAHFSKLTYWAFDRKRPSGLLELFEL